LRHSRNTSRDVYRAAAARASAILPTACTSQYVKLDMTGQEAELMESA
jgi:hypothetical protein